MSSSGKSTLIKAILCPTQQSTTTTTSQISGNVTIATGPDCAPAKPIYLYQKPPYEARLRVEEVIEQQWSRHCKQLQMDERQQITLLFAKYLGFECKNNGWLQQTPSQLSPSEAHRFALLLACLESSCSVKYGQCDDDILIIPAPILLLDEWMDTETSTVIQAVQKRLWTLVQATGALVVTVTHKPERWTKSQISQTITLNAGKILNVEESCCI